MKHRLLRIKSGHRQGTFENIGFETPQTDRYTGNGVRNIIFCMIFYSN